MAALFVSYSHADQEPVSGIAHGLERAGHAVWWDRRLRAHQDYGREIEAALGNATCAVVAWSSTARDSLWVRAEATAALDSGKLVQLSLDGAKPPLPFTMIHLLDFPAGARAFGSPSWHLLEEAVDSVAGGAPPPVTSPQVRSVGLAGLGPQVLIGAASLALIIIAAGIVGVGATGRVSTNVFGLISGGMLLAALLAFGHMLTRVISVSLASR
jgi:TIR domain